MSTPALALCGAALPATSPAMLAKLVAVQDVLLGAEQIAIQTEHVLHGGIYARTIRLKPRNSEPRMQIVLCGAHVTRPTVLIVNGPARVLVNDGWAEIEGYNVFAASAGRKQMFVTVAGFPLEMTVIFPTRAKTVAEAEEEFTDEASLLVSRRPDAHDTFTITDE